MGTGRTETGRTEIGSTETGRTETARTETDWTKARSTDTGRTGQAGAAGAGNGGVTVAASSCTAFAVSQSALAAAQRRPSACPHCEGQKLWRWGRTARGLQRWQCRGCRRSCSSLAGTAIAAVHAPAKLDAVIVDMAKPRPQACRALAKALQLDKSTVWEWRRTICLRLAERQGPADEPIVERFRVVFRESRKASREWVRHASDPARFLAPDRRRWVDYRRLNLPLPCPMTPYRIVVDCAPTGQGGLHLRVSGTEQALADGERSTPVPQPPAAPPESQADCRPRAAALAAELRDFIRPFRGPATRHLRGYVAWLAIRLGRNQAERCQAIAGCLLA